MQIAVLQWRAVDRLGVHCLAAEIRTPSDDGSHQDKKVKNDREYYEETVSFTTRAGAL